MSSMDCPICKTECDEVEDNSFKCPDCSRTWYEDEQGNIMSKKRKVTMKKMPEEGDNINDVIGRNEEDLDYDVMETIDGNSSDGVMNEAMAIYQEWLDWNIKKVSTKEAYKKKGGHLESDLREKNCNVERNKIVKTNGNEILTAVFKQDGVNVSDLRILVDYNSNDEKEGSGK